MQESYLKISDCEYMYVRHNRLKPETRTILFVHGLGDSGLSFEDVFKHKKLSDSFNIVVPDLIGYGRSSGAAAPRYSFASHIERLRHLIDSFKLNHIILAGHSMGGDITTLMCQDNRSGLIKKYINIEGDVTQHELFVSSKVVEAFSEGKLEAWFYDNFMYRTIFKAMGRQMSGRLYFASLNYCRLEAVLENSRELVERNTKLPGEFASEIGQIYLSLDVPRVFCYGTKSLSNETLRFLTQNNMPVRAFEDAGHSLMVDSSDEFYEFVREFADQ